MAIRSLLQNKSASEKMELKGKEIAKLVSLRKTSRAECKIKVLEIKPTPKGVEVFAQAWDKNNNQIGFGKDGTVDIERFIIVNPPILVDDPNGDIVKEWIDSKTGEQKTRKLKEDTKEALLQSLEHTIKLVGKDGSNIIKGKRGNTVSTFYPSFDGVPKRVATESLNSLVTGNGTTTDSGTSDPIEVDLAGAVAATPTFKRITRAVIEWDTSSIPDTDDIDSAVFSFYAETKFDEFTGNNASFAIVQGALATAGAVASSDYQSNTSATRFASDLAQGSITTSAYNDMTLNATGRAAISKTGDTLICCKSSADADDSAPTVGTDNKEWRVAFTASENTGTTQDPKLVVTHTAGSTDYPLTAAVGAFTLSGIAAVLNLGWNITAAVGAFTLSGISSILSFGRKIIAEVGSYTLTGISSALLLGIKVIAAAGSFTLTGIAAALTSTRSFVASAGAFTLSGIDSALSIGHTIVAAVGSFALSGLAVALHIGRNFIAAVGTFTLTGIASTFQTARLLVAAVGSFSLSGIAANILKKGWTPVAKNVSSFTAKVKNASSWTQKTKN